MLCLYFGNPDSLNEFTQDGLRALGGEDAVETYGPHFTSGPPFLMGGRSWGVLCKCLDWFTADRMLAIAMFWPWAEHDAHGARQVMAMAMPMLMKMQNKLVSNGLL